VLALQNPVKPITRSHESGSPWRRQLKLCTTASTSSGRSAPWPTSATIGRSGRKSPRHRVTCGNTASMVRMMVNASTFEWQPLGEEPSGREARPHGLDPLPGVEAAGTCLQEGRVNRPSGAAVAPQRALHCWANSNSIVSPTPASPLWRKAPFRESSRRPRSGRSRS
jgi:hypothetical protein